MIMAALSYKQSFFFSIFLYLYIHEYKVLNPALLLIGFLSKAKCSKATQKADHVL